MNQNHYHQVASIVASMLFHRTFRFYNSFLYYKRFSIFPNRQCFSLFADAHLIVGYCASRSWDRFLFEIRHRFIKRLIIIIKLKRICITILVRIVTSCIFDCFICNLIYSGLSFFFICYLIHEFVWNEQGK